MALPLEIVRPGTSAGDVVQQDLRAQVQQIVGGLKLVTPNMAIKEATTSNNYWQLSQGSYPKFVPNSSTFWMEGIAGTQIAGASINEDGTCNSIEFTAAINITANGRVVFNACKFDAPVTVAAGGKATFNGCIFLNNSNVDNTAGLAADVAIIGTFRGATAHVNCTVIWENTL